MIHHLVVQGADVPTPTLKELARRVEAKAIEQIAPGAFRLREVRPSADVAALCDAQRVDHAWVPAGQKLSELRVVIMDMDSTLINIECIDEIADMHGFKPQVAQVTAAAMRGELPFAESLKRRVKLLKGLDFSALQQVYEERLRLNPGAEQFVAGVRQAGLKTVLVSGGFTWFVDRLKARLGLDYAFANELEVADGKLTGGLVGDIIDAHGKANVLKRVCKELSVQREQSLAVGDGANDLEMMMHARISVAYHAKPIVREQATYALNYVGLDGILRLFE